MTLIGATIPNQSGRKCNDFEEVFYIPQNLTI